jgi:heterodisulfide reductase subunit A2
VYVCHCGLNIARTVDHRLRGRGRKTGRQSGCGGVPEHLYACSEPGQQEIREDILANGLDRVVIGACSLAPAARAHLSQMMQAAGLNPYLLEMANLREQCSWVHMNAPEEATEKALDLVRMAVARVRRNSSPCMRKPSL